MKFIKRNLHLIVLLLAILIFIIYKIPHLALPYYWDEAWVYGPAVRMMAHQGLGLLPDALPVYYSRGHPLMFHFLAASWLQLFGNTVFNSHLFALLVSIILIVSVYYVGNKLFNKTIALSSAIFLMIQPVFLAQSALVLPEVMLALFCLLSVYYYLKRQILWYFIFASLMVLAKETGVAIVVVAFILECFRQFKDIKNNPLEFIKTTFYIGSPALLLLLFWIVQYFYHGWFLFPEHTAFLAFDFKNVFDKFESYGAYIFIYQGRNLLTFTALALFIYLLIRRFKIEFKSEIIALLAFIFGFMMISSVNFFSNRYVLSIIPLFLFGANGIIFQVFSKKLMIVGFVVLTLGLQIPILKKQTNSDHNLGYVNAVKANVSMINYCKDLNIREKKVYAYFITREILSRSLCGYVDENEEFTHLSSEFSSDNDYYIFSNFDTSKQDLERRNEPFLELVRRVDVGQAWIELYKHK